MADLLREAQELRRELEGVEGYLRTDTAERVGELLQRAQQARPDDRVLQAVGPASKMPSAEPHNPNMDPSFADMRGLSARIELEQVEAACEDASLYDRVCRLRRGLGGESGRLPKRIRSMFDVLMKWAREELPDRERLEVIAEPEPDPDRTELSELTYDQAEATLGLIECELEHADQGDTPKWRRPFG